MEGGQDVSFGRSNGIGIGCEKERRGGGEGQFRIALPATGFLFV